MAFRDMFDRVRDSVAQMTYRFLHGEDQGYYDQQGYGPQDGYYDPNQAVYGQESGYASPYEGAYQRQQAYQQPAPQQAPYQNYQQESIPPQEGYQSPYAGSYARQTQPQQRQSRAAAPGADKVVPFPGYVADAAGTVYVHELQIIQLRDRDECRAIIEHLKNKCTVALNMDNIANDTEKQRCVDMLSGAAYTLNCSISRISTRGVYVITPESVRVQQDEATRRLNGARQASQRPSRAHSYAGRTGQQSQEAYEVPDSYAAYPPQGGYPLQEEPASQGYQNPYGNDGEYRTAGYYAPEPRHAAGYGR